MLLTQDLKYAVRGLGKNPLATTVAVLVLAFGIGVNAAVFTLVNAMLFRPLTHSGPLHAVYVRDKAKPDSYRAFSYDEYQALSPANDAFDHLVAYRIVPVGLSNGDRTRRLNGAAVSSNYFEALGVTPAGRAFSPSEQAPGAGVPVVVVSHALAEKERLSIGRSIRLNGQDCTVVGIAPPDFTGTIALLSTDIWIPLGLRELTASGLGARGELSTAGPARNLLLIARLKRGVDAQRAKGQWDALSQRLAAATASAEEKPVLSVAPLSRFSVGHSPRSDQIVSAAAWVLVAMATLVLFVACLNLGTLHLARDAARRQEFALRLALGASRRRILAQLLTEGLVLSLAGGISGLLLSYWATKLLAASLSAFTAFGFVLDAAPDLRVLAFGLLCCLLATLASTLGPALKLTRADAAYVLKERASMETGAVGARRWFALRHFLVVGQVGLSLALVATAGLFHRGASVAADANPGFDMRRGLIVEIDASLGSYDEARGRNAYGRVVDRLRGLPEVEAVSLASVVPFGPKVTTRRVAKAGAAETETAVRAHTATVSSDYFRSLGLTVLRGRAFAAADDAPGATSRVVVVDEPLARRLWPGEEAVGRSVQLIGGTASQSFEVVGVVPGLRQSLFDTAPVAHLYFPLGATYQPALYVHVRLASSDAGTESRMLAVAREQIRAVEPDLPVLSVGTLRNSARDSVAMGLVRTVARLFAAFGAVALLIALLGVYSVRAFLVGRRTREIGLRMALGAPPSLLRHMLVRDGLILTAVGLMAGLVLALLCGKLVSSLLYRVSPSDPLVLLGAAAVLAATAALAAYLPAWRATRMNPMKALRMD